MTKFQQDLPQRPQKPVVKLNPTSLVSEYRAAQLNDEQNGFFGTQPQKKLSPQEMVSEIRAGQLNAQLGVGGLTKTAAGNVTISKPKVLQKTAAENQNTGASWRGTGGAVYQTPSIYSPLWLDSNLSLPRDRATINAWCRAFFTLNPYIKNAILLHSTYPISKLNIKCKNLQVKEFFENMMEELDLEEVCIKIAQEFWMLGEAFPYAELNESEGKWNRIFLLNPDYVIVQKLIGGEGSILSMRPDQNLQRVVSSNNPSDKLQRQKLSPEIIEHVKRGKNIPLNDFNVHHLSNSNSDYEIRGQSLIVSCFRSLMLFDNFYECKFAQADNMINPWLLVKVGGGTGEFKPNPIDLEFWRETIEMGQSNRDYKIITHDSVTIEPINRGAAIHDTSNDITQLIKNIYIGLMVPSVLMDGGSDTTYANGSVALDVLKGRYIQFRHKMAKWLRRKIFAPIAKINDFYEYKDVLGEKKKFLIVPEVDWNHMSLFDMGDYIDKLIQLRGQTAQDGTPGVSEQTIYRSLGLDWEEEQQKIREEMIQEAIKKKEKDSLAKMSLTELRSLNANTPIDEKDEGPLPGQAEEEPMPGMEGLPPPPTELPPPAPPAPAT